MQTIRDTLTSHTAQTITRDPYAGAIAGIYEMRSNQDLSVWRDGYPTALHDPSTKADNRNKVAGHVWDVYTEAVGCLEPALSEATAPISLIKDLKNSHDAFKKMGDLQQGRPQ